VAGNASSGANENNSPVYGGPTLPLTSYDDYLPYIDRIAAGEENVLTADPVLLFEPSSGSTAASKLIPYTRSLQAEFRRGISPWIHDLFTHFPALKDGPAYWSISPLTDGPRRTPAGIPIGFADDSAYLGRLGGVMEAAMAVPGLVKHLTDINTFRYVTLLFLLRCADLRLISVWPDLPLRPAGAAFRLVGRPAGDIAAGGLRPRPPGGAHPPPPCCAGPPRPGRARDLAGLRLTIHPRSGRLAISCWATALPKAMPGRCRRSSRTWPSRARPARHGSLRFLPLAGKPAPPWQSVALLRISHRKRRCPGAHQLKRDGLFRRRHHRRGLYRYRLHDLVEISDFYQVPCLKFIGKADHIADTFGEKLNQTLRGRRAGGII
jgi:hypothetical protein